MEQVDENPELKDSPQIGNFNSFLDGADFLRLKYPLEDAPVVVADCSELQSQTG